MAWLNLLLKGRKVAGAIKSVKPQVKPTGTKSLINKYKDTVKNIKSTPEAIEKKSKAVKDIHKFVKKHGGTKTDEAVGAAIKGKK
jgi:hypothetical protein